MTPEERQMLAGLFERINAAGSTPRDRDAEAFINDATRAAPFAPYVLAQTVLVQQHALEAAARRVSELEAAAQHAAPSQEQGSFLGNLGRSIFGGPPSAPPQPPRQGYDPAYQQQQPPQAPGYAPPPPSGYAPQRPGPWGGGAPAPGPAPFPQQSGGGGGFLQNAASTATGVAGGVVLGNLLGGLFGGHSGGGGLFGGGSNAGFLGGAPGGGNETVNIFEDSPGGRDGGQFDPSMPDDAGFIDDSSFDDNSGGGFDDV